MSAECRQRFFFRRCSAREIPPDHRVQRCNAIERASVTRRLDVFCTSACVVLDTSHVKILLAILAVGFSGYGLRPCAATLFY
jgi:hypothetical protein